MKLPGFLKSTACSEVALKLTNVFESMVVSPALCKVTECLPINQTLRWKQIGCYGGVPVFRVTIA
jgi:hypothetical protein